MIERLEPLGWHFDDELEFVFPFDLPCRYVLFCKTTCRKLNMSLTKASSWEGGGDIFSYSLHTTSIGS